MSPVPKDAIFLAKTVANFALLYIVSLLVLGVFGLCSSGSTSGSNVWGIVLVLLALGSLGFVALGTLFRGGLHGHEYG